MILPIDAGHQCDAAAYDAWFRVKVECAMVSDKLSIPHDQVMAMAQTILDKHKPR